MEFSDACGEASPGLGELWAEAEEACKRYCEGVESPDALALKQAFFESGRRVRDSEMAYYKEHVQKMFYDHTGEYRMQINAINEKGAEEALAEWELVRKEYGFDAGDSVGWNKKDEGE